MDLNSCTFIGRLTADPELRYTQTGKAITKIRIAINKKVKEEEKTQFINSTCWGKLAELAAGYLKKGSRVYLEGELESSEYIKDGIKQYSTCINCRNFISLEKKSKELTNQTQHIPFGGSID